MFRNYIKIALRNLWKHKIFSLINVLGLAVGMTACFLIYLYVHFETSYDTFNTRADRIYRIASDIKTPSDVLEWSVTSSPVAVNMQKDFPEVESVVRISYQDYLVRKGNDQFQEKNTIVADSTLFSIFDFPLVYGDKTTALREPLSVVFSQTTARKYFGNTNPVGQHVALTGFKLNATVTGVMKDIPENSHLKADMVVSMASQNQLPKMGPGLDRQWLNFGVVSYLLLKPGTDAHALEAKFPSFINFHSGKELKAQQTELNFILEPLKKVYLYSTRDKGKNGNPVNIYIFSTIALFILLLACINFINLSTARSAERAREVGIRKVAGAARFQIARQFIAESLMVSFAAFLIAVVLCTLLLPSFNHLAGKQVSTAFFEHPVYTLGLLLASVGIGILAGIYPAFILSAFLPVTVLKGRFSAGTKGLFLRKGLVVGQFTISVALMTGTMIIYSQLSFMRKQDLGFDKDQTIVINTYLDKNRDAFTQSLSSLPAVLSSSFSSSVPGEDTYTTYATLENNNGVLQNVSIISCYVDYNYINQYKMQLVAGRGFSKEFRSDDSTAMVINERAVKLLGYGSAQQAIGKRFEQGSKGKIIGVVKDFHFQSLQQPIMPITMLMDRRTYQMLSVKIAPGNLSSTLKSIESKWHQAIPNRPFEYNFLDETFDRQYKAEDRFGSLFFNFALLAIFISCLGLLGLVSYSTLQRTREIGVRKVLGASMLSIVHLLSGDFLKLVLIAIMIASPLSWFLMHRWLQNFAYRTHISWWMILCAGLAAVVIAFGTLSFQAVKAALANPVKSLRSA